MFGFFENKLSLDEAKEIAQRVCSEKNWRFKEPVTVLPGIFSWTIVTNAASAGLNARIKVSRRTKGVTAASYNPR